MNDIVINLNKAVNISSQKAVTKVKHLFSAKKAGHAGTLDPMATGVLIVCLNRATKITRFLSDLDKEYVVRLKLGESTDTYDSTGTIIKQTKFSHLKENEIHKVLKTFIGSTKQIPPMYSAIKMNGEPLYKLARKGITVQRPERDIRIYEMDMLSFHPPYIDFRISCSKGTYIRTLCNDIGNMLDVGAHMVSLQRTKIGKFYLENAANISEVRERQDSWYSIDSALVHLREVILDNDSWQDAKNGRQILVSSEALTKSTKNTYKSSTFLKKPSKNIVQKQTHEKRDKTFFMNQYIRLKSPEKKLFGIGKVDGSVISIERLLN
jgi:tRNA pseudouridine55 synthase